MVIDITATYDDAYKKRLVDLWTRILLGLAETEDPKKIISFLSKCCIISIDEQKQLVYIGVPNEFVLHQVKKFFTKQCKALVQTLYDPHYSVEATIVPDLQQGDHELQIDLKDILPQSSTKEKTTTQIQLDTQTAKTLSSYFGILFQKQFTFDAFVVGSSNQLAFSVAEAIAHAPGNAYNPFFMYGGVGLGKTHLMQAIGNYIIDVMPEKVVMYLATSKFIDHIINAIRRNQLPRLLEKLDEVDVLMLDDIQFLAGKDKTQEIFHTIFNDFTSKHKQIVITSDQPPSKLTLLEPILQSRFSLGVVADIKSPDFETRVAILDTKLKAKGETLDPELVHLIASTVQSNVRELEGALNIILTRKELLGQDITAQEVVDALQVLGFSPTSPTPVADAPGTGSGSISTTPLSPSQHALFEDIIGRVASYYGIQEQDLYSSSRSKEVSFARQILMYIAKTHYRRSLQRIGQFFGGRNHASVIYAIKTFEEYLHENPQEKDLISRFV